MPGLVGSIPTQSRQKHCHTNVFKRLDKLDSRSVLPKDCVGYYQTDCGASFAVLGIPDEAKEAFLWQNKAKEKE